ncbi:MAG: hypothetical protein WHT46_05240 [Candidatus Geothermincolales bacterium]
MCLYLNETCCARCPFFSCNNNPYFNLALEIARLSLHPYFELQGDAERQEPRLLGFE